MQVKTRYVCSFNIFVAEGHIIITLPYRFGCFLSFDTSVNTCLTRANQINISQSFKRFMSATSKEIVNIREGRHEEQTTSCTKWAIKEFQGKVYFKLAFKMSTINY